MQNQREDYCLTEWRGYQKLAAAVIATAIRDSQRQPNRYTERDIMAARSFLTQDKPELRLWCDVANHDFHKLLTYSRQREADGWKADGRVFKTAFWVVRN
jgi:hypothetical protein